MRNAHEGLELTALTALTAEHIGGFLRFRFFGRVKLVGFEVAVRWAVRRVIWASRLDERKPLSSLLSNRAPFL